MQYFSYQQTSINEDIEHISFTCKGSKFLALLYPLPELIQECKNYPTKDSIHKTAQQQNSNSMESISEFRNSLLTKLQSIHKKAVHFVWAFRILNEYNHIIEGNSDDGEPKGSAGAPMLEVLRGKCLVNVLCICVRYFGGTKLGIGGLVRAYTQATLQAIEHAYTQGHIVAYKKQSIITIKDKSSSYNKILHLAKKHQLTITHKNFLQADMTLQIQGEAECIENFLKDKASM